MKYLVMLGEESKAHTCECYSLIGALTTSITDSYIPRRRVFHHCFNSCVTYDSRLNRRIEASETIESQYNKRPALPQCNLNLKAFMISLNSQPLDRLKYFL